MSDHRYTFSGGSEIKFAHLEHEKSKYDHDGAQYAFIGFDELIHFTRTQFFYLLSRNRSACGVRPYVRATSNPDASSWVKQFITWWLDLGTGLPVPDRIGVLRWFYVVADEPNWYGSRQEAESAHPDLAAVAPPKSCTFIPAMLSDNAILCAQDPGYRANLLAMSWVERSRLLDGNWNVTAADGMFRQEWFPPPVAAADLPKLWKRKVRAWDFACLVAGTLVETCRGNIPIEQVRADDYALTRVGFRRVKWAGLTRCASELVTVTFANGASITGTPDHPIWVEGGGWTPLGNVLCGDYTVHTDNGECTCPNTILQNSSRGQSPWCLMASPTLAAPERSISRLGGTIRPRNADGPIHSTERFGGIIRGQSPPDTTCITSMRTMTTMSSKTWRYLPAANTPNFTTGSLRSTALMPQKNTIENLPRLFGQTLCTRLICVKNVERSFHHVESTCRPNSAANSVVPSSIGGQGKPVYDLEVEGAHEFFANGVLVHNCTEPKDSNDPDWMVGTLMGKDEQDRVWVLDVRRYRISPLKVKTVVRETAAADGPDVDVVIEQEPAAAGKVLAHELRSLLTTPKDDQGNPQQAFRCLIAAVNKTTGDKVTRAYPFSAACEQGKVWLAAGGWVRTWHSELSQFPAKGVHDDQVDSAVAGFRALTRTGLAIV